LERDELPPHWDKEILFNMGEESTTESSESEEIDDDDDTESPEEKDHLVRLGNFKKLPEISFYMRHRMI
jgi:Ras-related protein Rab-1A